MKFSLAINEVRVEGESSQIVCQNQFDGFNAFACWFCATPVSRSVRNTQRKLIGFNRGKHAYGESWVNLPDSRLARLLLKGESMDRQSAGNHIHTCQGGSPCQIRVVRQRRSQR
jgi:hypothetical protein